MDDVILAHSQQLVDRFELPKNGANPWDANTLDATCATASHGEHVAFAFCSTSGHRRTGQKAVRRPPTLGGPDSIARRVQRSVNFDPAAPSVIRLYVAC